MDDEAARFEVHEAQRAGRPIAEILRPTSIGEALEFLADVEGARPIAGGTDLLLDLQRGGPGPSQVVVDMTTIENFAHITETDDEFVLGGGVTHNQVVLHSGIRAHALPLAQACVEIGSPQLRNRATIAGNIVTASPANDSISALMALDARVDLARRVGDEIVTRSVAVADVFTGFRSTLLEPGELIVDIHVPKLSEGSSGIWVKLGLRRAQAISVVHGACVVRMDGGVVASARLALGSVAPTVVLIEEVERALVGNVLDEAAIRSAARIAAASVEPIDDVRATADYRRQTIEVLVGRALSAIAAGEVDDSILDGAPALATTDQLASAASAPNSSRRSGDEVTVVVNGKETSAPGSQRLLLDWLREEASSEHDDRLSGTKEGCAEGECGACTVLLDGAAVMSCLVLAGQADGGTLVTVEGLALDNQLHPIQKSFISEFAVQCGFCIPGFLVAGARLLEENPTPTEDEIQLALSGNLCRCTGYYPIIEAVRVAGEQLR